MTNRRSLQRSLTVLWTVLLILATGLVFGQVARGIHQAQLTVVSGFALGLAHADDEKKGPPKRCDVAPEGLT